MMDLALTIFYYLGLLGLIGALGIFLTKSLGKLASNLNEKYEDQPLTKDRPKTDKKKRK